MSVVRGKDVLLEIYSVSESQYIPAVCVSDVSISFTPENIETTTVSSGRGITRKTRRIDWGLSFSGIVKWNPDSTLFRDAFTMVKTAIILAGYQIRLTFTDSEGNTAVFTGNVVLENGSLSGPQEDYADMDFSFLGNGLYTLVVTDADGNPVNRILMENGDALLLETGDFILLENA